MLSLCETVVDNGELAGLLGAEHVPLPQKRGVPEHAQIVQNIEAQSGRLSCGHYKRHKKPESIYHETGRHEKRKGKMALIDLVVEF
jgi:Zn-finger nucleic acid-binding protein